MQSKQKITSAICVNEKTYNQTCKNLAQSHIARFRMYSKAEEICYGWMF